MSGVSWLHAFAAEAGKTDRLVDKPDHKMLLAAGLMGEAGSIVAELKKERREVKAYPVYRNQMLEEVGDFLWYFARLVVVSSPHILDDLPSPSGAKMAVNRPCLAAFLAFGAAVGDVLASISNSDSDLTSLHLRRVWDLLGQITVDTGISLSDAAAYNRGKTNSRWPEERQYKPFFDEGLDEEELLPRHLRFEFRERTHGLKNVVLRCNGINFGDRLTDNIHDPDGYRFHDIFHFAYAVHLGWSPVMRALLRCKRKSKPKVDESQDGARAGIIEEAVSAIVFSRAKQLNFFEGLDHVDYDLLKTIREFVEGFEVSDIPIWQWEHAILDGYRVFRLLRENSGGHVTLDLTGRTISYSPSSGEKQAASLMLDTP